MVYTNIIICLSQPRKTIVRNKKHNPNTEAMFLKGMI